MDEQAGPPKVPRWVKVIGIIAGVVLLLAIVALAFGGGQHGPGRHFSSGDSTHGPGHTPPSGNSTTHHGPASDSNAILPMDMPAQIPEGEPLAQA